MRQTIVIAQGGGPTAVINQTLVGAALEAREAGMTVLGSLHGVRGIRDNRYVELTSIPEAQLMAIAGTPSAALGSTRDKPDEAYCEAVLKGLKAVGADAFVYIGGNDTAGTQAVLAGAASGAMTFVHAPKTIDNDLEANDHTPGFISAGAFVAGAFLSIDLDFRALPGIYVGIVMGRHAGFLTAAADAWRIDEDAGPHLLYVPERAFDPSRFIDDVKRTMDRHKRCIIAVSEGVSTADGRALVESLVPPDKIERDEHGNLQLSGTDLASAFGRMLAEGLPGQADTGRHIRLYAPRQYCHDLGRRSEGGLRGGRLRGASDTRGQRVGGAPVRRAEDDHENGVARQRRWQDAADARQFPAAGRE
jgi:6-phosphofructokinase